MSKKEFNFLLEIYPPRFLLLGLGVVDFIDFAVFAENWLKGN